MSYLITSCNYHTRCKGLGQAQVFTTQAGVSRVGEDGKHLLIYRHIKGVKKHLPKGSHRN